jgi:hypothetical protein
MSLPEGIIFDGISLIVVIADIILSYIIARKAYNLYKRNKMLQTKLFSIASLFSGTAMIFLIIEKLFLMLSDDKINIYSDLGMWVFSPIAVIISGCAVVVVVAFSSNMALPKYYKWLTIIATVFISIYVGFYIFDPNKHVENGEIVFDPWPGIGTPITLWIVFSVLIPLIVFPVFLFFYYAIKVRKKSDIRYKKALLMGFAGIFLASAYLLELMGLPSEITCFTRIFFILSGILFYWALFKISEK